MSTFLVALLVAVIAPLVLSVVQGRQRRGEKREDADQRRVEKQEDYERQDQVAARVREAAEQAEEAATLLVADNKIVAAAASEAAGKTFEKLDEIHTLVNSNMTAAMQAELDATVREAAMMREVIALHDAAGRSPSAKSVEALEATEKRIGELHATLVDRHAAQDRIDAAASS